jgi:hypothetical protein
MTPFLRTVLLAVAAVLAFDVAAAAASRAFGFAYASVSPGSYLIYFAAGLFGARAGGRVRSGMLAGAAVGLADSSLGWMLSAWIGPGRPPAELAGNTALLAATAMFVTVFAAFIGLLGASAAWLAGITGRRRTSR